MRPSVAVAIALLAALETPLAAQATRDRPTLVFTVSGAYLDGIRLWTVPDQPVDDNTNGTLTDHFLLRRNVKKTLGAGFSGTYYRGAHIGITAEAFLLGLGYSDICEIAQPVQSTLSAQRCQSITDQDRSAAAVAITGGAVYRFGAEEFISPFLRAGATIAAGRGYQIRWEIRDNIVGIQRVTGPTVTQGTVPPHETSYRHIFSLNVGLDVILEKRRGRRY